MQYRHFLMALFTSVVFLGCAATPAPPVCPAFQRLSSQMCALIRKDYPDAKIEAGSADLAASVRMAPPTTQTNGPVYVTTYGPEKTGFYVEMYLDEGDEDVPTPEEGWEVYGSTSHVGIAYLAGTRQKVRIDYCTGSSAPKGFNRAMQALIRHGTEPYHRPKPYHPHNYALQRTEAGGGLNPLTKNAGKDSIPPEIVGIWVSPDFKSVKSRSWPFPGKPVAGFILYICADGKEAWLAGAEIGDGGTAVYQANTKTVVLTEFPDPSQPKVPPDKDYLVYDDKAKTLRMTEVKSASVDDKTDNGGKLTRLKATISASDWQAFVKGLGGG